MVSLTMEASEPVHNRTVALTSHGEPTDDEQRKHDEHPDERPFAHALFFIRWALNGR